MNKKELDPGRCSNDHDIVTLVNWIEDSQNPDIYINFITMRETKVAGEIKTISVVQCYAKDGLAQWLSDPEKMFARWVQNPHASKPMVDKTGEFGMPEQDDNTKNPPYIAPRYYQLYTGEFILKSKYTDGLKDGIYSNVLFDTKFLGPTKLGNLKGSFGSSALHGQDTENVYELIPSIETPIGEETKAAKPTYKLVTERRSTYVEDKHMEVLIQYYVDKDGKRQGKQEILTLGGKLLSTTEFVDDKRNGKQIDFYYLSTKYSKRILEWKDDKKDGKEVIYYKNGLSASEENYKGDKLNGVSKSWNEDHMPLKLFNYKDGKLDGIVKIYTDKTLVEESHYKDDKLDGSSEEFFADGSPKKLAHYKDDNPVGRFRSWYTPGILEEDIHYSDNGDSKRDGLTITYYKNGGIATRIEYKNDMVDGLQEDFYVTPKNQLREKITFKNGYKTGKWINYDKKGQLMFARVCDDASLVDPSNDAYSVKICLDLEYIKYDVSIIAKAFEAQYGEVTNVDDIKGSECYVITFKSPLYASKALKFGPIDIAGKKVKIVKIEDIEPSVSIDIQINVSSKDSKYIKQADIKNSLTKKYGEISFIGNMGNSYTITFKDSNAALKAIEDGVITINDIKLKITKSK